MVMIFVGGVVLLFDRISELFLQWEIYEARVFSSRPNPYSGKAVKYRSFFNQDEPIGYPAQPRLICPSVCLSVPPSVHPFVCPSVRLYYLQIRYSKENGTGPIGSVNFSSK